LPGVSNPLVQKERTVPDSLFLSLSLIE